MRQKHAGCKLVIAAMAHDHAGNGAQAAPLAAKAKTFE